MFNLSADEFAALRVSCLVASTAVALSLPFGVVLGWLLARGRFRGKSLVEALINLPLVLPPVVTGYLLLRLFGRNGPLGGFMEDWLGIRLVFDWKGAALASAVVAFPLMVRAIRVAFVSVDSRLEQAARTLGAGPWDTFFTISLPLARHGLTAGCVLAFARSMGEFGATIMIAGSIPGETRTIPLFIYIQLESPGGIEQSQSIVVVSVLVSTAALIAGEFLERRSRTRLGLG
ncbi:molybdate ABC transporter permease subunit [bacterium]|nr:molybdate ABC transporter permease subunit [bacterium]